MEKNYDDTFLARWEAGELTEAEQSEFEKSTEYSEYKKISEGASRLEAPSYDRQKAWEVLKIKRAQTKKGKVRSIYPYITAIAASIILIFGYFLFLSKTTLNAELGTTETFELSENVKVSLNSGSNITFRKFPFFDVDKVTLHGEAQFEVIKGTPFSVETNEGIVSVLGTRFIVNAQSKFLDVQCFEGKVAVNSLNVNTILKAGKAYRFQNDNYFEYNTSESKAAWLSEESTYYNTPVSQVIEDIERKYNIRILNKEILPQETFTGRFGHKDLSLALDTVLGTLQIKYTFDNEGNVILKSTL